MHRPRVLAFVSLLALGLLVGPAATGFADPQTGNERAAAEQQRAAALARQQAKIEERRADASAAKAKADSRIERARTAGARLAERDQQ